MKKILVLILTLAALFSVISTAVWAATADFGYGAAVVASDVNMIKTGLVGKKLRFSDADFKSALCLADFDSITVTKIPSSTEGTLFLGGRRVAEGRVISKRNLSALVFVPASDDVSECSFGFKVEGYAGGAEIECIMKFIDKINYAPSLSEDVAVSVSTQESVCVYGSLACEDPEGDALDYFVISYPERGGVELIDGGRYCYTPEAGFTGKDGFVYVARDEYGNYTEPISVKIRVGERMSSAVYVDMEEREEYNAALVMTAMGVMNGRVIGDGTYFMPDEEVSRAEFVAMAMKCAGIRADTTLTKTYFDDDAQIPTALKGYIATAQRMGLVNGDFEAGLLTFKPNEAITKYEAAKIMASLIGADAEGEESVFAEDTELPVWARAGVIAMRVLGIFDDRDSESATSTVTRASAASYLYKMTKMV